MKISKRRILISLTDNDLKGLDELSSGYSRSATIATLIRMNKPDGGTSGVLKMEPITQLVGNDI